MTRTKVCLGVCLFALILVLSATAQDEAPPAAPPPDVVPDGAVPRLVRFSGVLQTVYGEARSGLLGVTFALYKDEGGAPLWLETQNVEVGADGRYTVLLGATKSEGVPPELFAAGEARWLGIQFKGEKEQRVLLVSVPYALKAGDAETLGGKPASAFVQVPTDKASQPPGTQSNALGAVAPFYTATSDGLPSLISLATSVPPLTVLSSQLVTNLNADMVDGQHATDFGDITAVLPGVGLSDGGTTGDVTLNVNTSVIQARVSDSCAAGEFIQSINQAGAVLCVTDTGVDVTGTGTADTAARSDHTHEAAPLGQGNTGVGVNALAANAGASNTAVGASALLSNTASENTAVGRGALALNTGGFRNTAVGTSALFANTTAGGNTAVGSNALGANTTAGGNTAVGDNALRFNTTGLSNTAVGTFALLANTTGELNTALGSFALSSNTANNNTAVGAFALDVNTTGFSNTAVGASALLANTAGIRNTAVGAFALDANTSGGSNTALGVNALGANDAGGGNTAVGALALNVSTNGNANTAVGFNALGANTTGELNTALGSFALSSNTANNNTAVGASALFANTTGTENTSVGSGALISNTTGASNTAVGANALSANLSGSNNIAIGMSAGGGLVSGSQNIYIGSGAASSGESNSIHIGNAHTTTLIAGIRGVAVAGGNAVVVDANGQFGDATASSRRLKQDIDDMGEASARLLQLRPVVFRYRQPAADGSKPIEFGLIAEEVAELMPELGVYDAEGQPTGVRYHVLPALLLNELQRQEKQLQQQNAELAELRARLEKQDAELAELKAALRTTLARR